MSDFEILQPTVCSPKTFSVPPTPPLPKASPTLKRQFGNNLVQNYPIHKCLGQFIPHARVHHDRRLRRLHTQLAQKSIISTFACDFMDSNKLYKSQLLYTQVE